MQPPPPPHRESVEVITIYCRAITDPPPPQGNSENAYEKVVFGQEISIPSPPPPPTDGIAYILHAPNPLFSRPTASINLSVFVPQNIEFIGTNTSLF